MSLQLNRACQDAVELAKRTLPDGQPIDVGPLLSALYHTTALRERWPALGAFLDEPRVVRRAAGKVPVADSLKPVLAGLQKLREVTPDDLFEALVQSEPGRRFLAERGVAGGRLESLGAAAPAAPVPAAPAAAAPASAPQEPAWRTSPERREAIEALASFGRMLTAREPPDRGHSQMEGPLKALLVTLSKMGRKNVVVLGHAGTGKTALVYELARRLVRGHASIPAHLRDLDIFELSPTFLRSGASVVGQYEERLKALVEVLTRCPKIVLFVDEIHSFFQSGVYSRTPFSDANEMFKGVLARGEITCIGCTTPGEFRHFIEPDEALARRFEQIRLEPPSTEVTRSILQARLPRVRAYFRGLEIPEEILGRVVELTTQYLPARHQPDKSIQLLDRACALCVTDTPPAARVTEEALLRALEATLGRGVVRPERLTEEDVYERLREQIVGQDPVLREIAQAFVAGLGQWLRGAGPRGVYLFAGPTGVGKTEVALRLAEILGAGRECLLRVDCNTLQGSGYDSAPIVARLLGAPPGYVGYARGQGGLLTTIRDLPESVVLFDEFEKADPGVGELLLRILDEGTCEDVDGNVLDFRRSFVVLTTNAGCRYDAQHDVVGFRTTDAPGVPPRVDLEDLWAELRRRIGLGQEFLARITHTFLFRALDAPSIRVVLERQLGALRDLAGARGYRLTWTPEVVEHLASQWQPRFGVRHLTSILRHRITERLSVADVQGELAGVTEIRLQPMPADAAVPPADLTGFATHHRHGDVLVIDLA